MTETFRLEPKIKSRLNAKAKSVGKMAEAFLLNVIEEKINRKSEEKFFATCINIISIQNKEE